MVQRLLGLWCACCLVCIAKQVCAQQIGEEYLYRPKFFEYSITELPPTVNAYLPEATGNAGEQEEDNSVWSAKLRLPFLLKEKLKIIGELKYKTEILSVRPNANAEQWERINFRNAGFSLFYDYKINDTYYLMGHLGASKRGDQLSETQLDDASSYGASILLGKHTSEICRVGFGLKVGYNLGRFNLIPIFMYNRKLGKRLYLDIILPKQVQVRYAMNKKLFAFFSAEADGSNFAFGSLTEGAPLEYRRRQVDFKLGFEYEVHDWIWVGANVGYTMPFNSVIVNQGDRTRDYVHNFGNTNALLTNVSIFLVPPRKLFNKMH